MVGGLTGDNGVGVNAGLGGSQTTAGYSNGLDLTDHYGDFGKGGLGTINSAGGGGGLYGGGAGNQGNSGAGGGSGYTDGCIEGTTQMTNGVQSGDGYAKITLISF